MLVRRSTEWSTFGADWLPGRRRPTRADEDSLAPFFAAEGGPTRAAGGRTRLCEWRCRAAPDRHHTGGGGGRGPPPTGGLTHGFVAQRGGHHRPGPALHRRCRRQPNRTPNRIACWATAEQTLICWAACSGNRRRTERHSVR